MNAKKLIGEDLPIAVAGVALVAGLAQALGAATAYTTPPEPSRTVPPQPASASPPSEAPAQRTSSSPPGEAPDRRTSSSPPSEAPDRRTSSSTPGDAQPPSAPCPAITIPFALGSAELDREARQRTQALAVWATAHPEATFVFDGHADTRGDDIANLRLSKLRSSNVSAIFQSLKIDKSRLTARGFGTFVPAGGVAEDRRVAITILGGTCPPAEGVAR